MSWIYNQQTGQLFDLEGIVQGTGYSGQPPHTNKPADEGLVGLGPIPCGDWVATSVEMTTSTHGPFVIVLTPDTTTRIRVNALGRDPDSFRMHGDSVAHPGFASEGCIIMPRNVRELFWNSENHDLQVVSGKEAV